VRDWADSTVVGLALSLPTIVDVILVKALYTPLEAGEFAVVAVLGKIVLFPAIAVSTVLVPRVAGRHASQLGSWDLLNRAFGIVLAASGVMAAVMLLIPEWMVLTFFGSQYLAAASLLRWYGVLILPFALVMVLSRYHQALGHVWYLRLVALSTVAQVVAIALIREGPITAPIIIGTANAVILVISYLMAYRHLPMVATREEFRPR